MTIPGFDLRPVYNAFDVMASQQSSPPLGYESSDDSYAIFNDISICSNKLVITYVFLSSNKVISY